MGNRGDVKCCRFVQPNLQCHSGTEFAGTCGAISEVKRGYQPYHDPLPVSFACRRNVPTLTAFYPFSVFQGLTPSFWGSLSDSIGRRPVYIMTLSIYVGACIGLALTPTSAFWLLLVLRIVQATGGSAVISIGSGCVSDIATPEERGRYMGLFSALSMAGPAVVSRRLAPSASLHVG
jgi:MFS family permease